jgi:hypothetical protein
MRWFHVEPSSSCPSYIPGLYTAEEIDDLVNIDGYIPVASATEFDTIRTTGSNTMGAGTCWAGTYTTGVTQKYVQVTPIDFTAFGTWTTQIAAFEGIYDGNELVLDNITATNALFSAINTVHFRNIRITNSSRTSAVGFSALLCQYVTDGSLSNTRIQASMNVTGGTGTNALAIARVEANTLFEITDCVIDADFSSTGNNTSALLASCLGTLRITDSEVNGVVSSPGTNITSFFIASSGNVQIMNCVNNADITSTNGSNAAGIGLGLGTSTVELIDCINNGVVFSIQNAYGIIVCASTVSATITGCTNNGLVHHDPPSGSAQANQGLAGICGGGLLTAINCINNSNIDSFGPTVGQRWNQTSGMFIRMVAGSYFEGNINNGNVHGASNVASIIGTTLAGGGIEVVNCVNNGSVTGGISTAGLFNGSSIILVDGCINNGNVNGVRGLAAIMPTAANGVIVRNSKNTGTITAIGDGSGAANQGVAGLVHNVQAGALMEDCVNDGDVIAVNQRAAGFSRNCNGTIRRCINRGNISGGSRGAGMVIFPSACVMEDCVNEGDVNMTAGAAAGIVEAITNGGSCVFTNLISHGQVTGGTPRGVAVTVAGGTPTVSGVYYDSTVGPALAGVIGNGETTTDLQTPTSNTGIYAGYTIPPWDFGTSSDYPTLTTTP